MKKLIITGFSTALLSATLVGCGWNTMDTVGSSLVSTGTNVVTTTGTVVGSGVDLLVGRPVTHADMVVYRKHGVIYRNGHSYAIQNGRYIIVR